jgi:hypothetical protein
MNHLGVLVGVSSEYFENVKRLELNAAAAVPQRIHDHLSTPHGVSARDEER